MQLPRRAFVSAFVFALTVAGWQEARGQGGGAPPADDITQATDMAADTLGQGLMHVVYFWLDPELTAEQTEEFLTDLRGLANVPTVRRLWVGKPAATPSRGVVDNSFDYSLVVWFDDVAGHDAYQAHPIHLAFVEAQEAKFARVRVRDSASE